jgi:hypothetical protein
MPASGAAVTRVFGSTNRRGHYGHSAELGGPACGNYFRISRCKNARGFIQNIGIALASLGTFDDLLGDDPVGEIVCKP